MDLRDFFFRKRGFIPLPFVIVALIWAEYHPLYLMIGVVLLLGGESLRIVSVRYAGGATRTRNVGAPDLVVTGPYGYVRNPLYLGNVMIYVGFSLASGAFFPYLSLVVLIFFSFQYAMIISLEEETLTRLFKQQYESYRQAVPRLFPRFSSYGAKKAVSDNSFSQALRQERSTLQAVWVVWLLLAVRLILFQ